MLSCRLLENENNKKRSSKSAIGNAVIETRTQCSGCAKEEIGFLSRHTNIFTI